MITFYLAYSSPVCHYLLLPWAGLLAPILLVYSVGKRDGKVQGALGRERLSACRRLSHTPFPSGAGVVAGVAMITFSVR